MSTQRKNSFDINFYAVLMIGALAFMIFIMGCNPSSERGDDDDNAADSSMSMNDGTAMKGDDMNSASSKKMNNGQETSTNMSNDQTLQEYTTRYPEMEYTYVQTPDGKIATVKGNYQVKVDGIDNDDDMQSFVSYVEQRYANKEMMRKEYNKNVETPATPQNGYDAFYRALKSNIEYPEDALADDIGGTVFVEFIVDEKGNITDVEPMEGMYYTKSRRNMDELDQAATSAIKKTQWTWTPATQGNKPVKMKLEIPITFEPQG